MSSESGRSLRLPERVLSEIARHAVAVWPRECCGILTGSKAASGRVRVETASPAENLSQEPGHRYIVSPASILEAQRLARDRDLEIVGYYHSHPGGSARPSELDRRDAWPGTSYVILGLEKNVVTSVRSWRLDGRAFVEEDLATD